jgi:uncharacterized protein YprB with RNaseH-like and TPR domain
MKIIKDELTIEKYESKAFNMYFGGLDLVVFDLETTGLFAGRDRIILSGMLMINGDRCTALQLFAEQNDDEREIVEKTIDILTGADAVVTYNGRSFDIPFLETRAQKYGLKFSRRDVYDLDLYFILSGYSDLKSQLNSLSQKSIERFCGLSDSRDDEINGYESVRLYERYLTVRSFELEKKILLHNHDDIVQLYRLLPVLRYADLHHAMFSQGFPAGRFIVTRIDLRSDGLHIKGQSRAEERDYISFPTEAMPCSIMISSSSSTLEVTIPSDRIGGGIPIIDVRALLGDKDTATDIEKYPNIESGYLILKSDSHINHLEINAFILELLSRIQQTI